MRIAPRTLLCGTALRVHVDISGARFEELRQLCAAAGDKASLAIGMAGLVREHMMHGRVREASRLASETMALVESIGDPTLTVGLSIAPIAVKVDSRRDGRGAALVADRHRPGRRRPDQGKLHLRVAVGGGAGNARHRPVRRWAVRGWRDDSTGRWPWPAGPTRCRMPSSSRTPTVGRYRSGVLLADDAALREIEEALRIAERSGEDFALGVARSALGVALVHRDSPAERERGLEVLGQVRDMCLHGRFYLFMLPAVDVYTARERARRGDRDGAHTATA